MKSAWLVLCTARARPGGPFGAAVGAGGRRLCGMATAVHKPAPPPERPGERVGLSIGVSESGAWAAAVNRLVGDAARDGGHPVGVSVRLDDGADLRLSRLLSAPGRG